MPMRPPFVPGGGGGGGGSTVIWSVDFSAEPDHDFTTTASVSMGGVTFTAANASNASQLAIESGLLKINPNSSTGYAAGTFNAPELSASWADLMTFGAKSGSYDTAKAYVWRAILSSSTSPANGGPFAGIRTVQTTANKDLSLQGSGSNWRFAKGGSMYQDVARGSTGVTGGFRTLTIAYGQGSFSALSSTTDTHQDESFGGVPIYAGYCRAAMNNNGFSYLPAPPDILDMSAGTAQAYVGAWHWSGGGPGALAFERLELHEVG